MRNKTFHLVSQASANRGEERKEEEEGEEQRYGFSKETCILGF